MPVKRANLAGYVLDNMEGAVDQATFLAATDTPVAIVGARGTGKMYIARILHASAGGTADTLVQLDCREFRNRDDANQRIRRALLAGAGKTLVFKSPQLMSAEAQLRLARQMASRRLADADPPAYLPQVRFVGLFPDSLPRLVAQGSLQHKLASVFAGYPVQVPPLRHRKQAILRWAYKILGQESASRNLLCKGFTPEAEQAMRQHDWHGNISEIRQRVVRALDSRPGSEWLTPLDLQLFLGDQATADTLALPLRQESGAAHGAYSPSAWEELELALAELVNLVLRHGPVLPLGTWLADEVIFAARSRYPQAPGRVAAFLQTSRRNINRWLPGVEQRSPLRSDCGLWLQVARLVGDWVRALGLAGPSPLEQAEALLLAQLEAQQSLATVALRAQLLGVSKPTYLKKARRLQAETAMYAAEN